MAASYPNAIKIFTTFLDQTQVIYAAHMNEVHDEVIALEKTIGVNPFLGTPYTSIGGALNDLYNNKAPLAHTHAHSALQGDATGDDHTQYIRVDGTRAFTGPVVAPNATLSTHLATLGQLTNQGYLNTAQANALIAAAAAYLVNTRFAAADTTPGLLGFPNEGGVGWSLTGGYTVGNTDGSGFINVPLGSAFGTMLLSIVATKLPAPGGGTQPPYDPKTSDLALVSYTLTNAVVQVTTQAGVQANKQVAFSWLALGQ